MKKHLMLFSAAAIFFVQTSPKAFAGSILTFHMSAPVTCAGTNLNVHLYMPNGTTSLPIYPAAFAEYPVGNVNKLIQIMDASKAGVWNHSASASCSAGWERQSWVVPGDGKWYMTLGRPSVNPVCTVERPAIPNPSQPAIQFVYQVEFKEQTGIIPRQTSAYFYVNLDGSIVKLSDATIPNDTKRQWSPAITHQKDCDSYFVSYCGDGVVDNGAMSTSVPGAGTQPLNVSEQCDLGAQNGQSGSTCSSTCTLQQP